MSLREQILEATSMLIREEGVATLRTRRIAEAAGCSEGLIFKHFGSKGGLLAAVLSAGLPEARTVYDALDRAKRADLRAGLLDVMGALYSFYSTSMPIVGSVLGDRELFTYYADAHRAAGSGPAHMLRIIAAYLQDLKDRALIDETINVEFEALALAGASQNAAWVTLIEGADALPGGADGFVDRLVDARLRMSTAGVRTPGA
ncbi:TetR/AcrR family transcriptional regulator [Pseudonocardia kujensis]|uniref:TetR/AcrR family transcriptional regulator n=1 Tax=Pseudonocardia kujensis TaxID=1128675 RepID=UPI001E5DE2ED|nr:TetR/AcrR family transcriptional regulator [Pseudonocardia kujensis]MCE0765032.1 TetR/AcrR family transcriptional regulator [Pseudonocardia kujensis]